MLEKKDTPSFLWGAATASYQVEGGIENCDWAEAAREGRVPPCGQACDHYHRYKEDFALAKKLGHNAHRFSVEWARIEPEEGKFDEKEVAHYREVLRALRAEGLEPFLCLWHWTLPLWLVQTGGLERADFDVVFARYATFLAERLGDLVVHVSTLNEPYSTVVNGYVRGTFPPFHKVPLVAYAPIPHTTPLDAHPQKSWRGVLHFFTLANTLARAHGAAYAGIHTKAPHLKVSVVFQIHVFDGVHFWQKVWARFLSWQMNHRFLKKVAPFCDELGINFYFWTTFGGREEYSKTDMGWDARPFGVYHALKEVARYKKPVLLAEAGCADAKDTFRAEYIRETLRGVMQAKAEGVKVEGFFYWSLLDNYEWAHGFEKRFGLVAVDFATQERAVRTSALVYKEIIEKSGE